MHFSTVYTISTEPPPHPSKKIILEFIHLSVCLSVCLTGCLSAPVGMSQRLSVRMSVCFSVCIRKQVSINWKFHTHCEEETKNTDSLTTAISFCVFSSAKWLQNYTYKITTNFTTELEAHTPPTHNGSNKE